jgi:NADH-quinone oxidoreductase subunit G
MIFVAFSVRYNRLSLRRFFKQTKPNAGRFNLMPKVTIDGQSIEVPDGTTILQAARMIGGEIVPPAMCYYTSLKTSGGYCRTCIVKVSKGSEKDPRPMPKPVASCRTPVMDGMEVQNITSPELLEARKGVV